MGAVEYTRCLEPGCGMSAEVVERSLMESTDGPIEHIKTRCPRNHQLFYPSFLLDGPP